MELPGVMMCNKHYTAKIPKIIKVFTIKELLLLVIGNPKDYLINFSKLYFFGPELFFTFEKFNKYFLQK